MMIPLSHRAVVRVSGEDRHAFLQGLLTNDMRKLSAEAALYSAFLTAQGKFLYDPLVCERDDAVWLDVERTRAAECAQKLSLYKLKSRVDISVSSLHVAACLDARAPVVTSGWSVADPRHPQMGWRVYDTAAFPDAETETYHRRRITLGLPEGSTDVPYGEGFILEHNFAERGAVDWQKGCYLGQELTARIHYRGLIRKRLVPLMAVQGIFPAAGTPLIVAGKNVGVARSSTVTGDMGLALLRLEAMRDVSSFSTDDGITLVPQPPDWLVPVLARDWHTLATLSTPMPPD